MTAPIGWDENCSPIGNPEWGTPSPFDDDYDNEEELSPLDDDFVREGYEDTDL